MWAIGRVSGFVSLFLLTRNFSLLSTVFLVIHVGTLLLDSYAQLRAIDLVAPFLGNNAAAMASVQSAVAQRADAPGINVSQEADTFISGEASAVVHAIGGANAIPRDKSQRLSESGLKKRPTVVLNVETLAHIALIARFGASWFSSVGADDEPGIRLLSISGLARAQVLEMAASATVAEVLAAAAVDPSEVQAILVGGYHGRWIKPLNYRLATNGPTLSTVRPGAGVIHLLGKGQCGLKPRHPSHIISPKSPPNNAAPAYSGYLPWHKHCPRSQMVAVIRCFPQSWSG
nr:hypothetical protein [Arthrobacter psychrolactophilus]